MSTGGIEPLKTIFRELPAKSGMAFVVVHHIRNVPTLLPEILSACTPMPVRLASGGLVVRPNHVYVLASGKQVTLADSFFSVRSQSKPKGFSNVLTVLRSLAKSNHRSIAVILSGVDADGLPPLKRSQDAAALSLLKRRTRQNAQACRSRQFLPELSIMSCRRRRSRGNSSELRESSANLPRWTRAAKEVNFLEPTRTL